MDTIIPQKRCSKCREEKPATPEFFRRHKKDRSGLHSWCKECCHAYQQEYIKRQGGRDTYKEYQREYRSRPGAKDRQRVYDQKRRAHKQGISGTHTVAQIQEQLERQKCKCYYCEKKFEQRYIFHVDHTFPLSRVKGTDIPANDISYLVLTCPTCNLSKNDKFPHEFYEGGRLL